MIKFRVRSKPKDLKKFIDQLPRHVRGIATEESSIYIVGNKRRGLKHYPRYKYVTRKRAYGRTFKSDKQRRYVMAQIKKGKITPGFPRRTGGIQRAWRVEGKLSKAKIVNDAQGVEYVMGNKQANLNRLVGWRNYLKVAKDNMKGAIQASDRAVQKWINRNS